MNESLLLHIDLGLTLFGIGLSLAMWISLLKFVRLLSRQVRLLGSVVFPERKVAMTDFTKLIDAVQKNTDLEESILQVLSEVASELKTVKTASEGEQAVIDGLVTKLTTHAGALTDAIVANTRAAQPAEPTPGPVATNQEPSPAKEPTS